MRPATRLLQGDCVAQMREMPDASVDAIVTDPPYGLSSRQPDMGEVMRHWLAGDDYEHRGGGFLGKSWDSFVPGPAVWREAMRVLKPGGHLIATFGTRTYDLGTLAIRIAGFEIRDQLAWIYGSGFPKSRNIGKDFDAAAGAHRGVIREASWMPRFAAGADGGVFEGERRAGAAVQITAPATDQAKQWDGWGTALKPALEPIVLARKPIGGPVAQNVLAHGAGAINIDGCRLGEAEHRHDKLPEGGRWPSNVVIDEEVAEEIDRQSDEASRFFYCHKAHRHERDAGLEAFPSTQRAQLERAHLKTDPVSARFGSAVVANSHPTVKPVDLMRWMVRLVTPPGGLILDPFLGSGTTGIAAALEGFEFVGIEREQEYVEIAEARIAWWAEHGAAAVDSAPVVPAPDQLDLLGEIS